jgi:hypothetical protein
MELKHLDFVFSSEFWISVSSSSLSLGSTFVMSSVSNDLINYDYWPIIKLKLS